MKQEHTISPEQSLRIISEMMANSKRNLARGGSFYIIFWGAAVGTLNFSHFLLDVAFDYAHPYIVWLGIIPAVIVSAAYGARKRRTAGIRSSIDGLYGELWWAIFACMLTIIFFMEKVNYNITAIILLLSALGIFITGRLIRFKPLVLGGLVLFIGAVGSFLVSYQYQNLISGFAMIFGYLVPGFLLRQREK